MPSATSPDVAVIGAGAAGLSAAALSSMLGARTMLIEKRRLGGDCTWTGCIPSKTLLDAAARWKTAAVERGEPTAADHDRAFARAMDRVRRTRETVYAHADTPERFESLGVDVRFGTARFLDARRLRIEGEGNPVEIQPRFVMVATGSRPRIPSISGLKDVPYMTNETVFDLSTRPASLAIVGGGPTGVELAQAFARFGVRVTMFEREAGILGSFPSQHVDALAERLRHEGVTIRTDVRISGVEAIHSGVRITTDDGVAVDAERLLVAAGRVANTDGLGLESAGVKLDGDILDVDRSCRTRPGHVYGIGDVATRTRFTHTAGTMARTAVLRALFKVPGSFEERALPAVVYTDPEIGCVGRREGTDGAAKVRQVHVSMDRVDRSLVAGDPTGEIRLRVSRWGRIRGADVLGANAGEIIGMISALIGTGAGIRRLSGTVLPYPTYSEGLGRAASKAIARSVPDRIVRLAARAAGLRGEHAGFDPDAIG